MSRKLSTLTVVIIAVLLMVSSCAPGGGKYSNVEPANFIAGIWHGWIAPFTIIIGIFNRSVRVYETFNTGWWYDFGFYIAVISGFGSLSLARGRRHRRKQRDDT